MTRFTANPTATTATRPSPPISIRRSVQPRCRVSSTFSANRLESPSSGASANIRFSSRSKMRSAMAAGLLRIELAARRQAAPEFIQTTFDMGFDRSKWRIQGLRRLAMGEAAAVAEADAQPLDVGQRPQGLVQVDARG